MICAQLSASASKETVDKSGAEIPQAIDFQQVTQKPRNAARAGNLESVDNGKFLNEIRAAALRI